MILRGRAWVFGSDVTTDHIAPGRYYHLRSNLPELAKHVLEDAREDFAARVKEGDFIVAGENFGLGSSREHATAIIKLAGVAAVIAPSYARIFYRNAINIGLPAVIIDTTTIKEEHVLEVDLENGILRNLTAERELSFHPLRAQLLGILRDGGLVEHVKKHGDIVI